MATTLKRIGQPSAAAAAKAERDRDKLDALREYAADKAALLANLARLRALRLTGAADAPPATAPTSARRRGRKAS